MYFKNFIILQIFSYKSVHCLETDVLLCHIKPFFIQIEDKKADNLL